METVSTDRWTDGLAINRTGVPLEPSPDSLCEGELLSPVFELSALSLHDTHRAAWMATEARRAVVQAAMQLGPNESIAIVHTVTPGEHGREALATRIWVERSASVVASAQAGGSRWNVELESCLALLSGGCTFAASPGGRRSGPLVHGAGWRRIQPAVQVLPIGSSNIGFVDTAQNSIATALLPVLASGVKDRSLTLARSLRAAASRSGPVSLAVRLRRVPKSADVAQCLRAAWNATTSDAGRSLTPLAGEFLELLALRAAELMRVELWWKPETDAPARSSQSYSMAEAAFSQECLPTHQLRRAEQDALQGSAASFDLSDLLPLEAEWMPAVLPCADVAASWGFPAHRSNPSIALPTAGLNLGVASIRGFERQVLLPEPARACHLHIVGATGTGKTTLMFDLIEQDMAAGRGMCLIDPHGDLFERVLAAVPRDRMADVVVIDPTELGATWSLNPLDVGAVPSALPLNRAINELLDLFDRFWDMRQAGGPAFENWFRFSMLLAATAPGEGHPKLGGRPTLQTVVEVVRDSSLRAYLLSRVKETCLDEHVVNDMKGFFQSYEQTTGDQSVRNFVPYITNKFTRFLANPLVRGMLCSPNAAVDFRAWMDKRLIVLVQLGKGEIGRQDMQTLGTLLTGRILRAAMSRCDTPAAGRTPFSLYLDEFQNFVGTETREMFAEARKYALQLVVAHQTLSQLAGGASQSVLDALVGNVASRVIFRLGHRDAELLARECLPWFDVNTLTTLPTGHAIARLHLNGQPSPAFELKIRDRVNARREQEASIDHGRPRVPDIQNARLPDAECVNVCV